MPARQDGLLLGEEVSEGEGLELPDVPGDGAALAVGEAVLADPPPAGWLLVAWPLARLVLGFTAAPASATVTTIVVPGRTDASGATETTVPGGCPVPAA